MISASLPSYSSDLYKNQLGFYRNTVISYRRYVPAAYLRLGPRDFHFLSCGKMYYESSPVAHHVQLLSRGAFTCCVVSFWLIRAGFPQRGVLSCVSALLRSDCIIKPPFIWRNKKFNKMSLNWLYLLQHFSPHPFLLIPKSNTQLNICKVLGHTGYDIPEWRQKWMKNCWILNIFSE